MLIGGNRRYLALIGVDTCKKYAWQIQASIKANLNDRHRVGGRSLRAATAHRGARHTASMRKPQPAAGRHASRRRRDRKAQASASAETRGSGSKRPQRKQPQALKDLNIYRNYSKILSNICTYLKILQNIIQYLNIYANLQNN